MVFNSLLDKYRFLGLPVHQIHEVLDFAVLNVVDVRLTLPYMAPVSRLDFFAFTFVKDGHGKYIVDEQTHSFAPCTFFFTNPFHYCSFECTHLEEVYLMTFSESFLKENVQLNIFDEFSFLLTDNLSPVVLEPELFNEMEILYLLIQKEYQSKSTLKSRLIGSLLKVLLLKLKLHFIKRAEDDGESVHGVVIVDQFKRTIERHFRELSEGSINQAYRLQDYARELHLHPNYLSNIIKNKTGKSIKTWIGEKTISAAKGLLLNSNLLVKEIGYRLGFSKPAHFSNYFKKQANVSPGSYRKMNAIT